MLWVTDMCSADYWASFFKVLINVSDARIWMSVDLEQICKGAIYINIYFFFLLFLDVLHTSIKGARSRNRTVTQAPLVAATYK